MVSERDKGLAAAHRSDKNRQAYIYASQRASSVIAKTNTNGWQATCCFLSFKSNPKTVYSHLRSVTGFCSSSPNFINCSFRSELSSVFGVYLRSHFSVFQPKALSSRARGYLSKLRRAPCPEKSHSYFCFPFIPAEVLTTASKFFLPTATCLDKVDHSFLKHLLRCGMDFL